MHARAMGAAIVGVGLALSIAIAKPKPKPRPVPAPTWADWAGSYRGALRSTSCTVPGAKSATVTVAFADGVASIDLAGVRAGMDSLTLVSDDHGWSARQGDLSVAIGRHRANTIDLAIELESGCAIRGRLTRRSTRIPACDRWLGWARIQAACTRLNAPARKDPAGRSTADAKSADNDLAKLEARAWKRTDAARCTRRSNELERALVDVGCAPHPDPMIGARAADCLALADLAGKLSRCGAVPQDLKSRVLASAEALAAAAQTAEKATLPYVAKQCRDVHAALVSIATRFPSCAP
jgi:hypothetical protein